MKTLLRDVLLWTLSLIFAGIMLVGFFAEIGIGLWYEGPVKIAVSLIGFVGCTWATNKTQFGRRICGHSFDD